jgi:hypothetical protein
VGGQRGSVVLVLPALVLVAALLGLGSARLGDAALARARADAVADVVALAAVSGGGTSAREVARRGGAALVEHRRSGEVHQVVVRVDGVRAEAAAEPGP